METTVGKILLRHNVPADLIPYVEKTQLDKKGLSGLFDQLVTKPSHVYRDTVTNLARLGFEVSTRQGSSVGLNDLISPVDKGKYFDAVDEKIKVIKAGPDTKAIKDQKIGDLYGALADTLNKDILSAGLKKNHTLAKVILSGSRGSPSQYRQTVAAPVIVNNEKGQPLIDFPIKSSFAEGLSIPEYLAHSYGTRQGTVATKLAVADSGYFCLSGDTEVRMADFSTKKISDIQVNDWVLGSNKLGQTFPVKVTNTFDNGIKDLYQFKFRNGKSRSEFIYLKATKEHEVLSQIKVGTKRLHLIKKRALADIITGFSLVPSGVFTHNSGVDYPYAHLVGLLIGDGCTTGNTPTFACADNELLAVINSELALLNLEFNKVNRKRLDNYEYLLREKSKTAFNRNTNGQVIKGRYVPIMKELDRLRLTGKKSHEKIIPHEIWNWSNTSIAALIAGLIETDGCVYNTRQYIPQISFTSVAKENVKILRELLQVRFGIYTPSIQHIKLKGKIVPASAGAPNIKHHNHDAYTIVISNPESVMRFHKLIPIKGKKLDTLNMGLTNYKVKNENNAYAFAYIDQNYIGKENVYDIEVDHEDHLYVLANGVVVSNSKQLSRAASTLRIEEHDCGTDNGIDVPVTERDSIGAYLARPISKYKKNNEVTPSMLADLANHKISDLIVRSPITCEASRHSHAWSVCQLCVGKRERGKVPMLGEYVGLTSATALGEPLSLIAGTQVLMADGFSSKAIEEIVIGDMIMGSDETGYLKPVMVTNVFYNGYKECFETSFRKGFGGKSEIISIGSTLNHKLLLVKPTTKDKFPSPIVTEIKDDRYRIFAKLPTGYDDTYLRKEKYALLCGLLIGDGCYTPGTKKIGIGFSCYDPSLIKDIEEYLSSLDLKAKEQCAKNEYKIVKASSITKFITCGNGEVVRTELREFLVNQQIWGQYSHIKTFPKDLDKWDNNSIAELISGLIATDGWVSKSNTSVIIGYSSTSEELVRKLKDILELRFGVYGTNICVKRKQKKDGSYYRPSFEFSVCNAGDVLRLSKWLHIPGVKQKRLIEAITTLEDLMDRQHKESGRFKMIKQVSIGEHHTYDLEVSNGSHLYVLANKLITHNSQGQLNTKHTSGSASSLHKGVASGFKLISDLANIPDSFRNSTATIAELDGVVTKIRIAPQGGHFVMLSHGSVNKEHYVPSGFTVTVKEGQHVEAGDVLSDGIINPQEVVKYKGIGEGRKYFTNVMKKTFDESGMPVNRRNFEVIARAAIDHVDITHPEGLGEHLPYSIASYQSIAKDYKPRSTSKVLRVDLARGKYLEVPVLHYTIGTKLSSSMINNLRKHKVQSVTVHDESPGFSPVMVRLLDVPAHVPDWMHQLYSTYLEKRLINAVNTGATSHIRGPSPIAGLAYSVGFGEPAS